MSVVGNVVRAVRVGLVLWVLTALVYPFLMIAVGQVLFPFQANGSMVPNLDGKPLGSVLVGQAFSSERFFQGRPSTTSYSSFTAAERDPENIGQKTGVSGASNLAPSNPDLLKRVQADVARLQEVGVQPTADLVYTSGSSLDPHMTVESAYAQLKRVAAARGLSEEEVAPLIEKHVQGKFLWIFGEPGVNVLNLNRELEALQLSRQKG